MPQACPNWRQATACLSLLLIDILSKYWVFSSVHTEIPIFSHFMGGISFSIIHVTNPGAAWGMLASYQIPLLIFRCLAIVLLGGYIFTFNSYSARCFPLLLIWIGAIGNVLDYFIYGSVIDMFLFSFWDYPFAVFNLADSAITIGVSWLAILSLFPSSESTQVV